MLSATVRSVSSRRPSGTTDTPAWRTRSGRQPVMSVPPTVTCPERVRAKPAMAAARLDLPAPFGPSSVVISPGGTSRETSCTTGRPPRSTVRSLSTRFDMAAPSVGVSSDTVTPPRRRRRQRAHAHRAGHRQSGRQPRDARSRAPLSTHSTPVPATCRDPPRSPSLPCAQAPSE